MGGMALAISQRLGVYWRKRSKSAHHRRAGAPLKYGSGSLREDQAVLCPRSLSRDAMLD